MDDRFTPRGFSGRTLVRSDLAPLVGGAPQVLIDCDLEDADLDTDVFRRRAEAFLFQRVAGQRVRVRIGDRSIDAGQSDRIGHFQVSLDLDEERVARLAEPLPNVSKC